ICGAWYELPVYEQFRLDDPSYVFADLIAHGGSDYRAHSANLLKWETLYSGNFSLPKRLFMEVGGFDEDGHRCHDLDLGYRLSLIGTKFRFSPECSALHI